MSKGKPKPFFKMWINMQFRKNRLVIQPLYTVKAGGRRLFDKFTIGMDVQVYTHKNKEMFATNTAQVL